jgi:hypothetical protein
MPTTYTPIMAPEGRSVQVDIEAFIDATGQLALRAGNPLEVIASHVAIGCDCDQIVHTSIRDFQDAAGTAWTVSAVRQLRSTAVWIRGQSEAYDEGSGWTDFIEVTVTAQANAQSKTKKIHVQTTSRKGLPEQVRPDF